VVRSILRFIAQCHAKVRGQQVVLGGGGRGQATGNRGREGVYPACECTVHSAMHAIGCAVVKS
jgi:hypothetical protein